jgi:D-sedoheptulose 7-phosphate isomerase
VLLCVRVLERPVERVAAGREYGPAMAGATGHEAAATLVAAARELAAAFDGGGRLLVTGTGRALHDARHVAVEFLHPVIVGRRALPAAVGEPALGSRDVGMVVAYGGARAGGPVDIVFADHAVPTARHVVALPPADGADDHAAKEAALVSYHLLWELTHLFLDGGVSTGGGSDALDALYPMIAAGRDRPAFVTEAVASTAHKLDETATLRAAALSDHAGRIADAARLIAGAETVFTFGNGGSATDAADLAYALGPKGWAHSDDGATVTALANDVSFDVVFARQLATLARPGDVVVALSTSGTSANVLAALAEAQRLGLGTIGLAGYDGGAMGRADLDVCCVVASSSVHRIQETYVSLYDAMVRAASA